MTCREQLGLRIFLVCVGAIIAGVALYQKSQEVYDLRTKLVDTAGVVLQAQKSLEAKQRAEAEAEEKRKTPPKMNADLKTRAAQNIFVSIRSENLIPFEFSYVIVTMNDLMVSGFPLDWTKVFPKEQDRLFYSNADIDWKKVRDQYVELRFRFRSLAPELFMSLAMKERS